MPLTLGRTAGFNQTEPIVYADGWNEDFSTVDGSSFTFTFTQIYRRSSGFVTYYSPGVPTPGRSLSELSSIPFLSARRALIISVTGRAVANRTISSVTAQVTAPVAGSATPATAAIATASSTLPVGIYVVELPPVSQAAETIDIVVTASDVLTDCAVSILVVPYLNSTTPIGAATKATNIGYSTLDVGNYSHFVYVANSTGNPAPVAGYRTDSPNTFGVRRVYEEQVDGGDTNLSYYHETFDHMHAEAMGTNKYVFRVFSPVLLSETSMQITASPAGGDDPDLYAFGVELATVDYYNFAVASFY